MEQEVLAFGKFLAEQPVNQLKRDIASFSDGYVAAITATRSNYSNQSSAQKQAEPESKPVGRPISTLRDTGWIPYETKSK